MSIKIFFCYAREDTWFLEQLKIRLKGLEREQLITIWYDREISAGKEWKKEIDFHLNSSQIILLLISPDFLASEYCYSVEMKQALDLHERGEVRVIPFITRPVDWENEPFHKLQALPRDARPLTTWTNQDEAFLDSVKSIRAVVQELNAVLEQKVLESQPTNVLIDETVPFPLQNQVATPSIIVLLGSTAALSALELMRHMLALKPTDKRRVAFVYIDTDDPSSPLVEFRRQHTNVFLEFPLRITIPSGISSASRIDESDQHTFIRDRIPQNFANGAGGIRNNGHVAACFNHQYIYDVLDRAVMAISRPSIELNATKVHEIQVNIVSFLGGGTGSGILADIAVMVRDLLTHRLYRQRLNLFCVLPEPISGIDPNDLRWRKSNAVATLLELLAYSSAVALPPTTSYKKYMRDRMHILTNDPIANEIYLVGHASMDKADDIARIVGLDLFQRITDASGVGFLEHSERVDRRLLGTEDDRGLPTMFGTSCPFEVSFPLKETAVAYAQISASHLLPLLDGYQPALIAADSKRRHWDQKWRDIARLDINTNDPKAIKIPTFNRSEFDGIGQKDLDLYWNRLKSFESNIHESITKAISFTRKEEGKRIKRRINALLQRPLSGSLFLIRLQHLNLLLEEYRHELNEVLEALQTLKVPARPTALETQLIQSGNILAHALRIIKRDLRNKLFEAYKRRLHLYATVSRLQSLKKLLEDLIELVEEERKNILVDLWGTKSDEYTQELQKVGTTSVAWQGKLEFPHLYQRHIFDLHTLRALDGRNLATEQLYRWATGGEKMVEGGSIDYSAFVTNCIDYLTRYTQGSGGNNYLEGHTAGWLVNQVVDFFYDYYTEKLKNMNLFELLDKGIPVHQKRQNSLKQVNIYLLEHLSHMKQLMLSLTLPKTDFQEERRSTLDTSLYFGMHWRDEYQSNILNDALNALEPLTTNEQVLQVEWSIDPHRLQFVYRRHAVSLSKIPDFYRDQHSAMEAYLTHQQEWTSQNARNPIPLHSSGEAERLVWDENELGYGIPLPKRILR